MSFKQHDINNNNMIHLGNYEEYFVLYMDNELTAEQVKMVDAFLTEHPDLRGEFELLLSTRLPLEELNISKNDLMADRMRLNTVGEELLLYIDNELPSQEKRVIELELKTNRDFQLQREMLMQTKLDPSEKLPYPNKKELYREEERKVAAIRPWMRVAAAAVVIVVAGVLYFNPSTRTVDQGMATYDQNKANQQTENRSTQPGQPALTKNSTKESNSNEHKLINNEIARQKNLNGITQSKTIIKPDLPKEVIDRIVKVDRQNQQILNDSGDPNVLRNKTPLIENQTFSNGIARNEIKTPSDIINNSGVTSAIANRKTDIVADPEFKNTGVASNKGSVKGFLRKTTRLIEKKTGIDPTSNGELLIGAVAINLN